MKTVNLYIDESGDLGIKGTRYFLICAIEINNEDAKALTKRAGRVINRFKKEKNIEKTTEIKGALLKNDDRKELLEKILYTGVKVRYIVLDIACTTMLLKKSDDKNACYNYLVQLLVKKLLNDYSSLENINLFLDNRSVKIGNRMSLKSYLYNKLVLEQLEFETNYKRIEFNIQYMESKKCYLIEWADILSNSLFKKYNSFDNTYYLIIKPYIIYESKFPSHNFGKQLLLID